MSTTREIPGLDVYKSADVVSTYERESGLQPGERTIFAELQSKLQHLRLLDIGIGAGRTTAELAPLVKEYVGVDYSPDMIRACEQRFPTRGECLKFHVCDARDLSRFGDSSFDLVLFSYNGMDCLPHEDRLKILAEVKRVLLPGGCYVFSSHNLLSFPRLFRFPWVRPLSRMRRKLRMRRTLLQHYPDFRSIANQPHAFLFDGTFEFRARHYYIAPGQQILQLEEAGFHSVRLFAEDGREATALSPGIERSTWIYYLCRR